MSRNEDIDEITQNIKPKILETFVSCVEEVLTEYLHNPKYLDEYYIDEDKFRELIGLESETFDKWKEEGKFDKAMHPATTVPKGEKYDKKRKYREYHRYHRWFNVYKQEIEIPDKKSVKRPTHNYPLMPKDVETILETAVFCVERVLTEYFRSPEYLYEYYIDAGKFAELIGLCSATAPYTNLKKKGYFDKAILPATKDGKHKIYHRWFNYKTGKIELPEWGAKKSL